MRKLSFLFAVLLCSWSMLTATNVKVRVLIPTDSEFTTTGDIVFAWKSTGGGAAKPIVLTREGTTRWWGATVIIPDETEFTYGVYTETSTTSKDVAQVGGWSPSSYVAKDKPELNLEIAALVDDESDPNERVFLVAEVAADAPDHDYRIADLAVQDIGNGVTITWTANNMAPNYYIEMMNDTYTWHYGEYVTVTEGKYTYYYDGTDDIHVASLVFFPCKFDGVSDFHPYVRMFQKDLDINFTNPETIIKKSLKAVEKDQTIEISWNHYPAAAQYDVFIVYDSWYKEQVILSRYVPAKDGKYTLTFDELPANGEYDIYFYAQNATGDLIADINSGVMVTGLPTLGEVNLRVLIPSDNDMNISDGVWFQWMDVETQTAAIVKADKDGRWYSKKITTDKSAIQFSVCNKSDASGSNSTVSPIVSTKQACFEMQYQDSHAWELRAAECDAQDHDYRMTDVKVAVSDPVSAFTITITAKDYALAYKLEAHESGVGSFETLAILEYKGSNTFTCPVPFTKAGTYEYRITPQNEENMQVAAEKTGTITLTAGNANMPTNLKVAPWTDNQTVAFSWVQSSPTTVDHYSIEVDDDGSVYKAENIFETSYSIKFYITKTHRVTWTVYAYSADGVLLAQASHGDMIDIVSSDYSPTELIVAVDGNKATMTWATPKAVQFCRLFVFDEMTGDFMVDEVVSGENGKFNATYTLKEDNTLLLRWAVMAVSQEDVAMSEVVDGEMFMLVGKAPTPRVPQTREMTPTIGHLYWDETGGTWSATVYEYNASQEPVMVFLLTVSGNKSTVPTTITLTNNTDDDNVFSEVVKSGEPQFGDMIKNANLTISYDGGLRTKDDGHGGIQVYALAKISGEMNSDFGDKLIVNKPANFIEILVSGVEPPSGIENVQSDKVQCTKVLRNGQLFILRDGKTYTATGLEVR